MIRILVRRDVGINPRAENRIVAIGAFKGRNRAFAEIRGRKVGLDLFQQGHVGPFELLTHFHEPLFNLLADGVDAVLMHGDLDTRFVFVVTATDLVPDRHGSFKVGQQVVKGDEFGQFLADHRCTAQTAAHNDAGTQNAVTLDQLEADVMRFDHGAVVFGPGDGDLEFTRHELEFRVVGGPLAQQFGIGARVGDLIRGGTGEMVGRHVADRVARGLNGVHPNLGQRVQHIRHVVQLGPVVLDVLTGGEVAIALVPLFSQQSQLTHLRAGQRAIGNGDTQHVRVQLQIQAVHQAQGFEFILGQGSVNAALDLCAELFVALCQKCCVELGVAIHD